MPDTRFLDFAQKSNFATEPWYAVGGVHLGPVEKLLCCRKLSTSSVCNMTGPLLPCTAPVLPASALLDQLLEHRTVLAPTEFGQGLLLQLPHPLTADPEEGANSL